MRAWSRPAVVCAVRELSEMVHLIFIGIANLACPAYDVHGNLRGDGEAGQTEPWPFTKRITNIWFITMPVNCNHLAYVN